MWKVLLKAVLKVDKMDARTVVRLVIKWVDMMAEWKVVWLEYSMAE